MKYLLAVLLFSARLWAGTVLVGDVLVGTCDSIDMDTQMGALEIFDRSGGGVAEFDANVGENICIGQMAVDVQGNVFAMDDTGRIFKFDANGNKVGKLGPQAQSRHLPPLKTILHDLAGNFFYAYGLGEYLVETGPAGSRTITLPEPAQRFSMFSDQQRLAYVGRDSGNIHSFDLVSHQDVQLTGDGTAKVVIILADSSFMVLDRDGIVSHWTPQCLGCAYERSQYFLLPSAVENIAADPGGSSFRAIHTWYDEDQGYGDALVYQVTLSGAVEQTTGISGLPYGRFYSGSLAVYGDGMNTQAKLAKVVRFGKVALPIGGTKTKSIAIKNLGQVQMTIASVGVRSDDGDFGEFAITKNRCMNGVKPGTHCNVWVTYKATRSGQQSGQLVIYANVDGNQSINLLGVGK